MSDEESGRELSGDEEDLYEEEEEDVEEDEEEEEVSNNTSRHNIGYDTETLVGIDKVFIIIVR